MIASGRISFGILEEQVFLQQLEGEVSLLRSDLPAMRKKATAIYFLLTFNLNPRKEKLKDYQSVHIARLPINQRLGAFFLIIPLPLPMVELLPSVLSRSLKTFAFLFASCLLSLCDFIPFLILYSKITDFSRQSSVFELGTKEKQMGRVWWGADLQSVEKQQARMPLNGNEKAKTFSGASADSGAISTPQKPLLKVFHSIFPGLTMPVVTSSSVKQQFQLLFLYLL